MVALIPQASCKYANENLKDEIRYSKNKQIINVFALCMLVVVLTGWFITNSIYLFRGNIFYSIALNESFINITNIQNQTIITLPIIRQNDVGLIIWLALSGPMCFLLLFSTIDTPTMSKIWVVIGQIICTLIVLSTLLKTFYTIADLVRIIYFLAALVAAVTVKLDQLAEILEKTKKALFFHPSVLLFGLASMIASFSVFAFTVVSFYSMDNILCGIFSLLGGIYLILVILFFAFGVIGKCVSVLYCSENKAELSGCIVLKSIGIVVRNHGGSILFISTLILPAILSIYNRCECKLPPTVISDWKSFFVKLFKRSHHMISFLGVYTTLTLLFIKLATIVSIGGAKAFFSDNSSPSKVDFKNAAVTYRGIEFFIIGVVAFTTVTVAGSVLANTGKEIKKSEEQEITSNQGEASEHSVINQTQEISI